MISSEAQAMVADGITIDQIPLETIVGEAKVLDFSNKGRGDKITVEDLKNCGVTFEKGDRLLLKTGWYKEWGSNAYYDKWPWVTAEAAHYLVDSGVIFIAMDTVYAIRDALASFKIQSVLLECDETLPEKLTAAHIDIAFNIAEGRSGRGREAETPALLNLLGIPFTGSDETTLCVALDKALCKRLLSTYRIRTPKSRVFLKEGDIRTGGLRFPLIVKPNAEGSSKGIPDACVASDRAELHSLVERSLKLYGGPVLAEEYIAGREFTVGLLGNGETLRVFPPMNGLPAEQLTLDTEQNGYRLRIIFQNINVDFSSSGIGIDYSMTVLFGAP